MTPTLAVLGAGPKAVAVAAKSAELRAMGVPAPDVVVVERTGVGAMAAHGIDGIDLLCVNLYPFEATVARGADFPKRSRDFRHPSAVCGATHQPSFAMRMAGWSRRSNGSLSWYSARKVSARESTAGSDRKSVV